MLVRVVSRSLRTVVREALRRKQAVLMNIVWAWSHFTEIVSLQMRRVLRFRWRVNRIFVVLLNQHVVIREALSKDCILRVTRMVFPVDCPRWRLSVEMSPHILG